MNNKNILISYANVHKYYVLLCSFEILILRYINVFNNKIYLILDLL